MLPNINKYGTGYDIIFNTIIQMIIGTLSGITSYGTVYKLNNLGGLQKVLLGVSGGSSGKTLIYMETTQF